MYTAQSILKHAKDSHLPGRYNGADKPQWVLATLALRQCDFTGSDKSLTTMFPRRRQRRTVPDVKSWGVSNI